MIDSMSAPSRAVVPLTQRLRERTAASHERIEAALDLLNDRLTLDRYAMLLERWHGFEWTWDRVAAETFGGTLPPGFLQARRRLSMLRADLVVCGRSPAAIAALPSVPNDALPWHDKAGALGVLYVIEGSTLGGKHVAKYVRDRLPLTPEHGIAYFNSYGDQTGVRWRETKAVLDAPPFAVDDEQVIAAAIATFDYLAGWLTR